MYINIDIYDSNTPGTFCSSTAELNDRRSKVTTDRNINKVKKGGGCRITDPCHTTVDPV